MPETRGVMMAAIVGLLMLMTFIGGRLIAPAVAGTLEKRGIPLAARVQPQIEGALLIILPLALVLIVLMFVPFAEPAAGLLLLVSAILIVVRTTRWKLWHCGHRPDLLGIGVGSLWLAIGALVTGSAFLGATAVATALHLITIGALGTLSTAVMLRLHYQGGQRHPPPLAPVANPLTDGIEDVRHRHREKHRREDLREDERRQDRQDDERPQQDATPTPIYRHGTHFRPPRLNVS